MKLVLAASLFFINFSVSAMRHLAIYQPSVRTLVTVPSIIAMQKTTYCSTKPLDAQNLNNIIPALESIEKNLNNVNKSASFDMYRWVVQGSLMSAALLSAFVGDGATSSVCFFMMLNNLVTCEYEKENKTHQQNLKAYIENLKQFKERADTK